MNKATRLISILAMLCAFATASADLNVSVWQRQAQATSGNVVADITGYPFDGATVVEDYDFGQLNASTTAHDNGSTIEVVFNLSDPGTYDHLISQVGRGTNTIHLNHDTWANGGIGLTIPGVADRPHPSNTFLNDEDAHVVWVENGDGTVNIFVNGVDLGSDGYTDYWLNGGLGTLGAVPNGSGHHGFVTGTVYCVGTYDRALTGDEIAALAAATIQESVSAVYPAQGADHIELNLTLEWSSPVLYTPDNFKLYLRASDSDFNKPNLIDGVSVAPGAPTTTYSISSDLAFDTEYFWRVDAFDGATSYQGEIWSFTTGGKATDPTPANAAININPGTINLFWTGNSFTSSYKLYAGTGFPLDLIGEVTEPQYPGLAVPAQMKTYYWRVDQYIDSNIIQGDIWSFTTREKRSQCPAGDINNDCTVDLVDLILLVENWLLPSPNIADITGNDSVNIADFAVLADNWLETVESKIVITEIHYNPDVKTELIEFIELYNTGPSDVDLSGWYFKDGISYTFPQGTIITAESYIVVTEDASLANAPTTLQDKFGTDSKLVFGPFTGGLKNDGEKIELSDANGEEIDQVDYKLGFPWPTTGDPVADNQPGSGCSIQLIHPLLDNDLGGSWRSDSPTPAAENSDIYASNIAPHIRQVKHSPKSPASDEVVTVTAKVTDSDGVASVTLQYQLVDPGNYIRYQHSDGNDNHVDDSAYENNWINVEMHDDGLDGDLLVEDKIFTVQLPGDLQTHRRLVRYRITVEDLTGMSVRVPYADDPQPNFAYFVYDGAPAWTGSVNPNGSHPEDEMITYDTQVMNSLPIYHLIAENEDIIECQYVPISQTIPQAQWYQWTGTLIYDGEVYDNIWYRCRGWWSAYQWGKNKFKFDFNRGHYFQGRDDYGNKYDEKWDKLNFSACIQQAGASDNRGEQGMFEALTLKLFNLASVPASNTNWMHFRVIDDAKEATADQYEGDFWGLYMALEQPDGRFLNEHNLADGNLYKMFFPTTGDSGNKNNQGPFQVTDHSDVENFCGTYHGTPSQQWWEDNVNLDAYYSYRTVVDGTHHLDLTDRWNCFYYNDPETKRWWMLPWDTDLSWDTGIYTHDDEQFKKVLAYTEPGIKFKNRMRELQDLLMNGDQCRQLIEEYAAFINDPQGGPSFVDADRAMWDHHPRNNDPGLFYGTSSSGDFEGIVEHMKRFIAIGGWGGNNLTNKSNDSSIPSTPFITSIGDTEFPTNDLRFASTAFNDPQGNETFSMMKWRIAEVEPGSSITEPGIIQLFYEESDWLYFEGTSEPSATQGNWSLIGFDDSSWTEGTTAIGYGENFINTNLDMRSNYTTIYLRKEFEVSDVNEIESLSLGIKYDDGVNIWINGTNVVSDNVPSQELPHTATSSSTKENKNFINFTLSNPSAYLTSGDNIIAIQVLNTSLNGSSDCFIDARMSANLIDPDEPVKPTVKPEKRLKYEIDTVWESDELSTFDETIRIPASTVKPDRTYRVRCKMKDNTGRWSHWSPPIQFMTSEPIAAHILDNLRLTELMFNPAEADGSKGELDADNDDFEFIELKNTGSFDLDLTGLSFTSGITFDFGTGTIDTLSAGEYVLVVKNQQAFESRYGTSVSLRIAGQYLGSLSNSGEKVTLEDYYNGTILSFTYKDSRGWPLTADGAGHSMLPLENAIEDEPYGTLEYSGNWKQSTYIHGSPGNDDPVKSQGVVINEIMAHTDYAVAPHESNDWIELYNTTDSPIVLGSDWYLSDDLDDLKKYALPSGSILANSWISFDQISHFNTDGVGPLGFGFNKAGEQILLSYLPGTSADRVVDYVEFKGQENDISLGRYPDGDDFFFAMTPTRDVTNALPNNHVVISEVMYHPLEGTTNEEYIELFNPTGQPVDMWTSAGTWAIDGGVNYTFPAETTMANSSRILIVGFDPLLETARLSDFETTYGTASLTANDNIFGPWAGNLSNNGERITLEKPQEPDLPDPDISWVIIDEVIYGDFWPWPTGPDGTGESLSRISTQKQQSGNDPANWQSTIPTPRI